MERAEALAALVSTARAYQFHRSRTPSVRPPDILMDSSWAERNTWTLEDQEAFFARLRRAQKRNRAQYLTRQARALASSDWPNGLKLAMELLGKAEEAGVDDFYRSGFHQFRAECLFASSDIEGAIAEYELAFVAQAMLPNVKVGLELGFAWEVATRKLSAHYDVALQRLGVVADDRMDLAWPANQYSYFASLALISDDLGDREGARRWATNALDASQRTESPFSRHKELGLVATPESSVYNELLRLAAA